MGKAAVNRTTRRENKARKWRKTIQPFNPIGEKQEEYVEYLCTHDVIFSVGPPGVGKTWVPVAWAAENLHDDPDNFDPDSGMFDGMVFSRPRIGTEKVGELPGDAREKIQSWALPIVGVLDHYLGTGKVTNLIETDHPKIELSLLGMMRGTSYPNKFMMLDEAQNATYEQIKMFITRAGEGATVVINGDLSQNDLERAGGTSGLRTWLKLIRELAPDVPLIEFDFDDNVRGGPSARFSRLCYQWELGGK